MKNESVVPNIEKVKADLEKIKEAALGGFPLKKGDIVRWRDKFINRDIIGRVSLIFFDMETGSVRGKIDHNTTSFIGWTNTTTYFDGTTDCSQFEKIKFDAEEIKEGIDQLNEEIQKIKDNIDKLTHSLQQQIVEKQNEINKIQQNCIHEWDEGVKTGKTKKHVIGESEVTKYTCLLCGAIGYN